MAIPFLIGGAVAIAAGLWAKNSIDNEQEEKERAQAYQVRLEQERKENEKKSRIALAISDYEQAVNSIEKSISAETHKLLEDYQINDGLDSIKLVTNTLVKFIKKDFIEMQTFPEIVINLALNDTNAAIEKIQNKYEKSLSYKERKNAVLDFQKKLEQLNQLENQLKGIN